MGGNYASAGPGTGGFTIPTVIGWGGANAYNDSAVVVCPATGPSPTQGTGQWFDVAPFQEFSEARVAVTTGNTSIIGNSLASGTVTTQFVGTMTATQAHTAITNVGTGQVAESFLAFSTTTPASTTINGNQAVTSATLLTVATNAATANGYYQMNNEVLKVTNVTGAGPYTLTVSRAQNGSTAQTAVAGDTITNGNIPGAGVSNPNHADIFAHAGFVGLSLNNGDSIQFTWQVGVTS
jgi:hypothetical protein